MTTLSAAPARVHRLVASQFPPIDLFDQVAAAADLPDVIELAGWTNDRLVAERLRRLPQSEWVFGVANASVVMAAFLHVQPGGSRFNTEDLGAWYAAVSITSAIVEVAHHLRREAAVRGLPEARRKFRQYSATAGGAYLDLRGRQVEHGDIYDPNSYQASQILGESVRASGGAGILYDSVRHLGGTNIVAHRPRNLALITQLDYFEITIQTAGNQIGARKLPA